MEDIWTAYVRGEPHLDAFFAHRHGRWRSAVEARLKIPGEPLDNRAVEEMARANSGWGVEESVVERAELLRSADTLVIATGQQPGIMGGPLYTLYKAAAAVRWAERLESELRRPVLAVFWIASDDDDLAEVNTLRWRDADGAWRAYRYQPKQYRAGTPLYDVPVEPQLRDALAEIFSRAGQSEFAPFLAERIGAIVEESADLEALFARTMAWLLGRHAPLFVSPRMKWVRTRAAPIFEREIATACESSRRVIEAGRQLGALGFQPRLQRRPDQVNCFVCRNGLRHRITRAADGFEIRGPEGNKDRVGRKELMDMLRDDPGRFGPNVVTRPIVQDSILPTVGYVAGPGEVGYLAQLRPVYDLFDAPMPIVLPRPRLCLIEPRVERALAKLGLDPRSVAAATADELNSLLEQAATPADVEQKLLSARVRLSEAVEFIAQQIDRSDPAVSRAFDRLVEAVQRSMDKLAERQRRAAIERNEAASRAAETVRQGLWPDGIVQERALTVFFPFLLLFGHSLIEKLYGAVDLEVRGVQAVALSSLMRR